MTIFTDSATISSTTTPITTVESQKAVDSTSIRIVSTPSSLEEHDIPDSATIESDTSITSDDRGPFTDIDIPSVITQITTGEYDYVHPTGYWGSFDVDDGMI